MFDLLLKRGTVIDPGQGIERVLDVAVTDGKIAAMKPDIPVSEATRVLNMSGSLVAPGLFDCHTHVYWGATSIGAWPDEICLPHGVTATVDGGSCGSDNFAGFKRWIVEGSRTRVFCYVNLSRIGLTGLHAAGELVNPAYVDPKGTLRILRDNPEVAVGVKLRLSEDMVGGPCLPMLKVGREVANDAGKPLHVHIGNSAENMAEVLPLMAPGDMVTHYQTPKRNGLLDEKGLLLPQAREARARGVLFDCGHGRTHFSLEVAARLLDQGFPPDTLSTDMSLTSFAELAPGLITVMNRWLALGMPLAEVMRACTSRPAEVLGKGEEFGTLKPGMAADIAVLRWEEGDFLLTDAVGGKRTLRRRLAPQLTIRAGQVV
jgi:dihydroorotase